MGAQGLSLDIHYVSKLRSFGSRVKSRAKEAEIGMEDNGRVVNSDLVVSYLQ